MKEIGGYIEFEQNRMPMMHENAIALNCGRNCLAYLIQTRKIKKIALPYFLCDSVMDTCEREKVDISYYHIDEHFLPINLKLKENEWLYFVNYYGQISNEIIAQYAARYPRIIVDHAQAYYQVALKGVDTLYTCRKFFGVPDGGFLYTDATIKGHLAQDESFERMHFLLGRYERTANEFYKEYSANNHLFSQEPVKRMSKLTDNLLHAIDYDYIKQKRTENFAYLHSKLGGINRLDVKLAEGAYMYPFYVKNGRDIRKYLQAEKIYIPVLWPHVMKCCEEKSLEYQMADSILPLPVDQRYNIEDMLYMLGRIMKCIS
jgi:hypothetical protein